MNRQVSNQPFNYFDAVERHFSPTDGKECWMPFGEEQFELQKRNQILEKNKQWIPLPDGKKSLGTVG